MARTARTKLHKLANGEKVSLKSQNVEVASINITNRSSSVLRSSSLTLQVEFHPEQQEQVRPVIHLSNATLGPGGTTHVLRLQAVYMVGATPADDAKLNKAAAQQQQQQQEGNIILSSSSLATTDVAKIVKSFHLMIREEDTAFFSFAFEQPTTKAGPKDDDEEETTQSSSRIEIKNGDTVVIVDNHKNPPLTTEQYQFMREEIFNCRELCFSIQQQQADDETKNKTNLPKDNNDNDNDNEDDELELWTRFCEKLQRPKPYQPDLLHRAYDVKGITVRRPRWQEVYKPLQPVVPSIQILKERFLVTKDPLTLHVYWRALDRDPGGNASFLNIRYVFYLFPNNNKSKQQQNRVQWQIYRNWDGENELCGPMTPSSIPLEYLDGIYEKIMDLILSQQETNATFHIVENLALDNSCYNTEWSSVEVLAFTTNSEVLGVPVDSDTRINVSSKESAKTPIFRLHQECLMGPQFRGRSEYHQRDPIQGTPAQIQLIQYVTELVGMGRVCQFDCHDMLDTILQQEGGGGGGGSSKHVEPSRAAEEFQTLTGWKESLGRGYEFPIMFR